MFNCLKINLFEAGDNKIFFNHSFLKLNQALCAPSNFNPTQVSHLQIQQYHNDNNSFHPNDQDFTPICIQSSREKNLEPVRTFEKKPDSDPTFANKIGSGSDLR